MKPEFALVLACCALVGACATPLSPTPDGTSTLPTKPADDRAVKQTHAPQAAAYHLSALLDFYQSSQKLSAGEQARTRSALAARPQNPQTMLQQAILYGYERNNADLSHAIALLDAVQKSDDPSATNLRAFAGLLAEQYAERQRLGAQMDKLGQLAKDSQKRAEQLQDKLDALAAIERNLPTRPATPLPPKPSPERTP